MRSGREDPPPRFYYKSFPESSSGEITYNLEREQRGTVGPRCNAAVTCRLLMEWKQPHEDWFLGSVVKPLTLTVPSLLAPKPKVVILLEISQY